MCRWSRGSSFVSCLQDVLPRQKEAGEGTTRRFRALTGRLVYPCGVGRRPPRLGGIAREKNGLPLRGFPRIGSAADVAAFSADANR